MAAAASIGLGVMMIELTATRALAPYFGSSHYTWTNVIGVVLLALSAGYFVGGRLADRTEGQRALLCLLLLGTGLMVLSLFAMEFVAAWQLPAPDALAPSAATGQLVRGSFVATLLLFAPPIFCFGATGPYLTRRLVDRGQKEGAAAGRTLASSTLGSLIGTYLPAHFLIEGVGVRATMAIATGFVLLGAGLIFLASRREPQRLSAQRFGAFFCALALSVSGAGLSPRFGGEPFGMRAEIALASERSEAPRQLSVLRVIESAYQHVRVAEWTPLNPEAVAVDLPANLRSARPLSDRDSRASDLRLTLDEGVLEFHSLCPEASVLTGAYYDLYAVLPDLLEGPTSRDVIVLGGGAGTIPRILRALHGKALGRIESVEIDAAVSALGPLFGWRADGVQDVAIVEDARYWLRRVERRVGLIVLDAYARQIAIPPHLGTVEFFRLVRSRMDAKGLFALNLSTHDLEGPLARALVTTLREVFPSVVAVSVAGSWNAVLVASNEAGRDYTPTAVDPGSPRAALHRDWLRGLLAPLSLPEGLRLTDDLSPLETLAREG